MVLAQRRFSERGKVRPFEHREGLGSIPDSLDVALAHWRRNRQQPSPPDSAESTENPIRAILLAEPFPGMVAPGLVLANT